jgi:hypothetical protein
MGDNRTRHSLLIEAVQQVFSIIPTGQSVRQLLQEVQGGLSEILIEVSAMSRVIQHAVHVFQPLDLIQNDIPVGSM